MCADGNAFTRFQLTAPERNIEELKEELAAIAEQYRALPAGTFVWEQAIIGESDRIFPPANQRAAWKEIFISNINGKITKGNIEKENIEKGNIEKENIEKENIEKRITKKRVTKEEITKKRSIEERSIEEGDIINGNETHYDESLFIKYLKKI